MKIWGDLPKVNGVSKSLKINKIEAGTKVKGKQDSISISTSARDYQIAMKALKDIPDIRKDMTEAVANKYSSGAYDVKGQEIADKIIMTVIDKKV